MTQLPKQYDPQKHEPEAWKRWEEAQAFTPSAKAPKEGEKPFVIMLPPPNITGSLHIGHALQDTIMDGLTRYHRMRGEPTLWLPGTDHAAIATNKIIEEQLHSKGKTRHDIGREEFLKRTEEWYAKTGAEILNQMKRLGCSCDWSRNRFTMDEMYYHAVQEAFVRFYQRGYIYRGERSVNWDPNTQTTVSDLEIEWTTEKTPFFYLQYGPFEIGTARPETKFGDKYVVMHPDDKRYEAYNHGDTFQAEWINGPVTATIIKDEVVDPAFGSGVMTITPWHDPTDFEIAQRHNLESEQIIGFDGMLLPIAGEFAGMPIEEARSQIVEKLAQKDLVIRTDENYEHNVSRNQRGKGMIEPQIMRQWFVDMSKLKKETIEVAEKELVQFTPPRWKKHFLTWMHNVRDWNINRQIWLGHRLPVWWKPGTHGTANEEGNYVVSIEKPKNGVPTKTSDKGWPASRSLSEGWEQDPDVLDTWFSSALWPFATLGWPKNTDDLQTFYPTTVLVTARDILYLWVARMMFSGLELMQGEEYGNRSQEQRIPFSEVMIHPTVLNSKGQRMSKSLGTGIDPLELIDRYGADATRFGLLYQLSYDSQALKFDEAAVKTARNFANKIWNIARLLNAQEKAGTTPITDAWIEQRYNQLAQTVTTYLNEYKLGEAARALYDFIWSDFADWYIEVLKATPNDTHNDREPSKTTQPTEIFAKTLKLLHPFMPHLTETLWHELRTDGLLITNSWPEIEQVETSTSAQQKFEQVQDVITTIRSARALLGLPAPAVTEIYSEEELIPEELVHATEKLSRSKISTTKPENGLPLHTKQGSVLWIGSDEITPERISAAQEKVKKEYAQQQEKITHMQKNSERMEGKASKEVQEHHQKMIEHERHMLELLIDKMNVLGISPTNH